MHSQRKEIKADHGPERPALGAFHQSLQPELCVGTICTCTVTTPPPGMHKIRTGTAVSPSHQRLGGVWGLSTVWAAVRPGNRRSGPSHAGEVRTHRPWDLPLAQAETQPNPTQPNPPTRPPPPPQRPPTSSCAPQRESGGNVAWAAQGESGRCSEGGKTAAGEWRGTREGQGPHAAKKDEGPGGGLGCGMPDAPSSSRSPPTTH